MKPHLKTTLSVLIGSLLLNACASGKGGFDLDNVSSLQAQGVGQHATQAPTYQDEQGDRRKLDVDDQEPALGYAVEIPRITHKFGDPNSKDLRDDITDDKVKPINHKLGELPDVFANKLKEQKGYYEDVGISYSHDRQHKDTTRDLQFVRSGYVIAERGPQWNPPRGQDRKYSPPGQYGYVFYQGTNPATTLPTANATYTGTWDFVSNVVGARTDLPEGFTNDTMNYGVKGKFIGATSLDTDFNRGRDNDKPVGLTSTFDVNFANKTMTGKLTQNHVATSNKQEITPRYTIDAKLKGNRFVGVAKANKKDHAIFGQDGALEGGFFGEKAEELAGKFLAGDNSLFGVFAGKRGDISDDKLEAKFDATAIDSKKLEKSKMNTFGQVSHLVIDGRRLALLPDGVNSFADMAYNDTRRMDHNGNKLSVTVCCNNLDYVKFGNYSKVGGTDTTPILSEGKLFLVGERTDATSIPKQGVAHYRGTWEGLIESKNGKRWSESAANNINEGARNVFEVDFGSNSLKGKLIGKNGLESNPILTLNGKIVGNGFSGKATTGNTGFNLDRTGSSDTVHINADFNGGFYGKDASELGGVIHHNKVGDDKIGAVFGAKRQTNKP